MLTGKFYITNAYAVAGFRGNPYRDDSYEYYVNERKKITPKAISPFILAALELNR